MERDGTSIETVVEDLGVSDPGAETSVARSTLRVTEPDGRRYDLVTEDPMRVYTLASFTKLLADHGPFERRIVCDRHYDLGRAIDSDHHVGGIVLFSAGGRSPVAQSASRG